MSLVLRRPVHPIDDEGHQEGRWTHQGGEDTDTKSRAQGLRGVPDDSARNAVEDDLLHSQPERQLVRGAILYGLRRLIALVGTSV